VLMLSSFLLGRTDATIYTILFFGGRLESCFCVREIRAGKRQEMLENVTPVFK
jgi:hypothetical protein